MIKITDANELSVIGKLSAKLENYRSVNLVKEKYYEGKNKLKNLGIALPEKMSALNCSVSWSSTAVDVLSERINLDGFTAPETLDSIVKELISSNNLDLESSLTHLDSLVFGIGYVIVGSGDVSIGENKTLITVESPNSVVGKYNSRTRKLDAALKVIYEDSQATEGTLFLPNETITFKIIGAGDYEEILRDIHNTGIVPVVPFVNKPRSSSLEGSSEITKTIMSLTDSAVRTLVGAELQRELYSSPGKYILGGSKSEFKDADGNPLPLSALMSNMLVIGVNEEGNNPQVGQWAAGSPEPFVKLLDTYISQISSATGIPSYFLGYNTANPQSGEALIVSLDRLIKKAEDRTKSFGKSWVEVLKIAILFETGSMPEDVNKIRPIWRSAAQPSIAAQADAATKLVASNILTSDSEVLYTKLGFTEAEKAIIRKEKEAQLTGGLISNLKTLAEQTKIENEKAAALAALDTGETPA